MQRQIDKWVQSKARLPRIKNQNTYVLVKVCLRVINAIHCSTSYFVKYSQKISAIFFNLFSSSATRQTSDLCWVKSVNLKAQLSLPVPVSSVTRLVDNVYQVDILTLSVDKIFGNKNAIKTEFVIEKNYPLISHEKMSLKQKFTIWKLRTPSHFEKKRKI